MSIDRMLHDDKRVGGNEFGNKKASYHTGKRPRTQMAGNLPLRKGGSIYPVEFRPKSPIRPGIADGNKTYKTRTREEY